MLLREALTDPLLKHYDVVILDEVHERTLQTDVILGMIKEVFHYRTDLKLIIMSATLDASSFQHYFPHAPLFKVPGSLFPVELFYTQEPEPDYLQAALRTVTQIHLYEPPGDVLLFLTGEQEILDLCAKLSRAMATWPVEKRTLLIVPLFSSLPPAQQQAATGSRISEYNSLISDLEGKIGDMDELIQEKTKILNELIAQAEEEERQARIQAAQNAASSMENVTIIAGDAQISDHQISLSDYELLMLATIIYCEAGNQSYEGQLAVGYVIMNRVRSSLYPSTLEGVLRQSKQFEPVGSGRFDLVLQAEQDDDIPDIVTQSCWNAAREVVNGSSNVGESLFFRTWAPVPSLITNLQNGGVPYWIIQDHIFYYYYDILR